VGKSTCAVLWGCSSEPTPAALNTKNRAMNIIVTDLDLITPGSFNRSKVGRATLPKPGSARPTRLLIA
jgi:hypothetical protein